jgi:uncharacterized protein (TIGR00251 family)
VKVKPGCSKTSVDDLGEFLQIRLKSPPVDGKANAELIETISKLTSVPKTTLEIVSGSASRQKTVFVPVEPEELSKRIDEKISKS